MKNINFSEITPQRFNAACIEILDKVNYKLTVVMAMKKFLSAYVANEQK